MYREKHAVLQQSHCQDKQYLRKSPHRMARRWKLSQIHCIQHCTYSQREDRHRWTFQDSSPLCTHTSSYTKRPAPWPRSTDLQTPHETDHMCKSKTSRTSVARHRRLQHGNYRITCTRIVAKGCTADVQNRFRGRPAGFAFWQALRTIVAFTVAISSAMGRQLQHTHL